MCGFWNVLCTWDAVVWWICFSPNVGSASPVTHHCLLLIVVDPWLLHCRYSMRFSFPFIFNLRFHFINSTVLMCINSLTVNFVQPAFFSKIFREFESFSNRPVWFLIIFLMSLGILLCWEVITVAVSFVTVLCQLNSLSVFVCLLCVKTFLLESGWRHQHRSL